jgi:acetyl esterase
MANAVDVPTAGSQAILDRVGVSVGVPTPQEARAGNAAMAAWVSMPAPSVACVEDLSLPASGTRPALPIRRFVPKTADQKAPKRSLVYFHGGGWVVGTLDGYAGLCSRLANSLQAQVFCVDYRLSPEVRYPVANHDCRATFEYLAEQSASLGLNVKQMLVGGDSAGGHLAITLCRWLKRDQVTVQPCGQVLIYPVADRSLDRASCRQFAEGFYLSRAAMDWYWRQYLPNDGLGLQIEEAEISPLRAKDLAGLPPTVIVTAGCDILRDEGEALYKALVTAGVTSTYQCVPGMLHGFIRFDAFCPESQQTVDWIASRIEDTVFAG